MIETSMGVLLYLKMQSIMKFQIISADVLEEDVPTKESNLWKKSYWYLQKKVKSCNKMELSWKLFSLWTTAIVDLLQSSGLDFTY